VSGTPAVCRRLGCACVTSPRPCAAVPHRSGSSDYEERGQIANMMNFAGMSGRELLEFLSPSRSIVQEGVIEVNEEFASL